jgi:hypothetical protein
MNVWIDSQTDKRLSKSVQSTSIPPHFCIRADNRTPQRILNQAFMLCPMVEGKRLANPVN